MSAPSSPVEKESNIFLHTQKEILKEAPLALVESLKVQMEKIKEKFPLTVKTVDEVLPVMEGNLTVLDVLVISYILNGGILLKHVVSDDVDLDDSFLKEFEWAQ